MKVNAEIDSLVEQLTPLGRPERAEGEKAYLKSDLEFLGVSLPAIRAETGAWLKRHPDLDPDALGRLARAMWRRGTHELRGVAIEILSRRQQVLRAEDIELLEWMLRRSKTWAYVDAIAVRLVGGLVEREPKLNLVLDRWSQDEDFWIRRSAMLALLLPLRRGEGDWTRFVGYADGMLDEREFFIRKAIGWVLREVSKTHPARVKQFLRPRIDRVSGVTLREAIKYLPVRDHDRLLAAYRAR